MQCSGVWEGLLVSLLLFLSFSDFLLWCGLCIVGVSFIVLVVD